MKKTIYINLDSTNMRLDRWFRRNVCEVPQSLIEKNIRRGNIKINGKKQKSSYKLKNNDKVNLFNVNFFVKNNKLKTNPYIATKKDIKNVGNIFIEDNENFAVINKPAGISVQSGTKSRKNILDILSKTKEFENLKPFTVHRIDKETTGLLIVAKNRQYAQLFTSLFRLRKIHKTYLSIVLGEIKERKGTYNDILFYYENNIKSEHKALTHFNVLDSNSSYSLLKLHPITGRKHQIRKQLLIHGHPVLGDTKYRLSNKNINNKNFLMLHAYEINFSINKIKYKFIANPPISFDKTLKEKRLKIHQ